MINLGENVLIKNINKMSLQKKKTLSLFLLYIKNLIELTLKKKK